MRTSVPVMVAALLLVSAGVKAQTPAEAPAQTPPASSQPAEGTMTVAPPASGVDAMFDHADFGPVTIGLTEDNVIDFGVRGTSFDAGSDRARFQKFQDLRNGATIDLLRYTNNTDKYLFKVIAHDVGYNDQRVEAEYNNYGKLKASFSWSQIPNNYSFTAQTLYNQATPGALTLSDGIQSAIQNKATTLGAAVNGAPTTSLASERDIAEFRLTYSLTPDVDLKAYVRNTQRNGTQPWSGGFGFSFAADQFPVPIDTRNTEVGGSFEWANGRAFAKGGYDGSFFRNNVQSVTWDNPLRVADSPTAGPAQARMALWPDTNENTVSVSGGLTKLPGHSTATAYVSVGSMTDNSALIPFTSNTALASPALPRATADLTARVTGLNFTFASHPTRMVSVDMRYRQYGFDNNSTPFITNASVGYDVALSGGNEADLIGFTRHTFDADVAFMPVSFFSLRGGYTRENVDYTSRYVNRTTQDTGRVSADLTGLGWLTLRGVYEHSVRDAYGLDFAGILADGEQPGLNQYDIANRNRDRASAILIVTPVSMISFNASVTAGKDTYPANGAMALNNVYEQFGLFNTDSHTYQVGMDFVPVENKVVLGATYSYEKYTALQASRNAGHVATGLPAAFFDPRDDWTDSSGDKAHTADVSLDVLQLFPKFDMRASYSYSKADSTYFYSLPAVTVLAAPVQLSPVSNKIQQGTLDGIYHLTRHVLLGATYWYSKYDVNDFAFSPLAGGLANPASNPSLMLVGYYAQPYNGNTMIGHVTYLW